MNSENHTKEISKKSSTKPVVIIGAGVGGLSIATLLVNDGHSVSVHENSERVGGRTTSMKYQYGLKRCSWCEVWLDTEQIRCPCCKMILRTKSRNKKRVIPGEPTTTVAA